MRLISAVFLASITVVPGAFARPVAVSYDYPSTISTASTGFTITEKTQVPGATLKPGSYSIRVVDRLSDRTILEIDDAKGKAVTTFLGLPGAGLSKSGGAGVISYDSGAKTNSAAIRGFAFPEGTVVEFVYPKAEAVSLAQTNNNKIPAIDPESEGRVAAPSLSKGDMQVVTLWMLSTTSVSADQKPGIQAEKYQQQQQVASAEPSTPAAASTDQGTRQTQVAAARTPRLATGTTTSRQPDQVAAVRSPRPVLKALPHTAGDTPLLVVTGSLFLLAGLGLTYRRLSVE